MVDNARTGTMEKVTIEDIDNVVDSATVKRSLTDALDSSNVAINYYELAPGDSFAYGFHRHDAQEEVFFILSGTATFETESRDVDVSAGEVIRFAPGEFQQGTNQGDVRVEAIALGAPREDKPGDHAVVLRECDACGERTQQTFEWVDDRTARVTRCADCGTQTGRFERTDEPTDA